MKEYFINPNKYPKGNNFITNAAEYERLEYFLNEIEVMAPHVCEQLYDLVSIYKDALDIAIKRRKAGIDTVTKWPDEWENLNEVKIAEFENLKDLLSEWATKNYLMGDKIPERFMIIALSAIDEFCHRGQDKEYNQLFYGKSEPKISLISGLEYLVNDKPDDFEEEGENFPFNKLFPFVFSPSIEEMIYGNRHFNDDYFGEHILRRERIKTILFKVPQEERERAIYEHYKENWEDGAGWDPRNTQWSDFEKKINLLFDHYKARYKMRIENFLDENGFMQSPKKKRPDHFKWLALSQLSGMTARQLIDQLNLSVGERTVSDAIEKSAKEIDLKVREKNKGGRPRNQ